ncbi:MAG: hypothetical protein HYV96_20980 [Opitutae bacterium]|nr:hypothetical protein [Opitutae bacterium]
MRIKLVMDENPWVAAENLERLKTAATAVVFALALAIGLAGLVIGLLQT